MINLDLLAGDAATFKGGRQYVHGTDIVTELDSIMQKINGDFFLEKIEFHSPLTTVGVVLIGVNNTLSEKMQISASGMLNNPNLKSKMAFCIFPSPLKVVNDKRAFDEATLTNKAILRIDHKSIKSSYQKNFNAAEHSSSLMKIMCKNLFPSFKSWWFVRLTKKGCMPETFENIEIKCKRIIAQRLVTAEILVNEQKFGEIDFLGATNDP